MICWLCAAQRCQLDTACSQCITSTWCMCAGAGLPSNNSTALAAGADQLQQPQLLASTAGGQVQHEHSLLQQQQLDQQHANMMAQQHQQAPAQQGLPAIDCADRNAQHEADALGRSCPASPTASHAAAARGLQDAGSAGGHAVSTQPAAAAGLTHAAAAADNADFGSSLAVPAPQQHRPDASRTPRDGELGTCPPYAAKAVWGLRYTMEDKWAAVPNLIQVRSSLQRRGYCAWSVARSVDMMGGMMWWHHVW
jgi:hypothetical protein